MANTQNPQLASNLPRLRVARVEATEQLNDRITKGKDILSRRISSSTDLEKAKADERKWSDYNLDLLRKQFDNTELATAYDNLNYSSIVLLDGDLSSFVGVFQTRVGRKLDNLESVIDRLQFYTELDPAEASSVPTATAMATSTKVFVVHGRDDAAKSEVAHFIKQLGLESIILHERPNAGRTIIEKFEANSDVGFAVVILTPDDLGGLRDKPDALRPRARQNVVFELGFFVGRLTRSRVAVLYRDELELPTDISGLVYTKMDGSNDWKEELEREMKTAGLPVDPKGLLQP